jgi:quinolinate synthase
MGSPTFISKHSLAGTPQPETVRAPEIEKGVGCDFDSYLLLPDSSLDDRIAAAKAKLGKDAVILGHHYQRDEVVKFADLRGDSLKLSQQAAEAEGKYIVFCGVHTLAVGPRESGRGENHEPDFRGRTDPTLCQGGAR